MSENMSKDERDWYEGRKQGIEAAREFDMVDTHSMVAPNGSSKMFASGWRLGFAVVRQERRPAPCCTTRLHTCGK